MQNPLAYTVTLHRVQPHNSTKSRAILQPFLFFSEEGTSSKGTRVTCADDVAVKKESIVEHHVPLRILLECFTSDLLASHSQSCASGASSDMFSTGKDPSFNLLDAYNTHGSAVGASLLSAEGLFIQLPSQRFISACARAAVTSSSSSSSDAMDIVRFNQSCSDSRGKSGDSADGDDGYIYGFVQYMAFGCAGDSAEGMLLGIFSVHPLFTLLRAIVLKTIPRIARVATELKKKCNSKAEKNVFDGASVNMRHVTELYAEALAPLAELVKSPGSPNAAKPDRSFTLRFARSPVTLTRPDDARYPFVALPVTTLLLSFSYKAIRVVQSLLIQEHRVIFIGATAQHAAACVTSVPALLVPFVWSYPLVPFLPASACCVLDLFATSSGGFVLGVTADMVPQLMLHIDLAVGLDKTRLWFADGRTGMVGPSLRDSDRSAFVSLNVMPPSEKLKDAIKRVVSKEQRRMFHVALTRRDTKAFSFGAFSDFSSPAMQSLEDLHVAFVEYNVSRLVGNYRKGLITASRTDSTGTGGSASNTNKRLKSSSGASVVLDYSRFLPANLENNAVLAQRIAQTRMLCHWSTVVASMETLGLTRCLLGEFIPVPRTQSSSTSLTETVSYSERFVPHYYFSSARMVALLCLFFTRAVRRFPDLYAELYGSTLLRVYESGNGVNEQGTAKADVNYGTLSTEISSTGESKGLVRSLFSRATKAVKNSLSTHQQQAAIQVFVQAYGSFTRRQNFDGDLPTPVTQNNQYWEGHDPFASPVKGHHDSTNSAMSSTDSQPCTYEKTSLYGSAFSSCIVNESSMGSVGRPDAATTTTAATAIAAGGNGAVCRRLPLDLIHQFEHYHALLNPTRETAYTTGLRCAKKTLSDIPLDQLEIFVGFGQILAGEPSLWSALEQARELLLCRREKQQDEGAYKARLQANKQIQKSEPEQGQEQRGNQGEFYSNKELNEVGSLGKTPDAPEDFGSVLFEAHPLPFSSDLITCAPALPTQWHPKQWEAQLPATASDTQHGKAATAPATTPTVMVDQQQRDAISMMTTSISGSSTPKPQTTTATGIDASNVATTLNNEASPSGAMMDTLFDFQLPSSAPNTVLQQHHGDKKELEDFFS